jgi:sporulation protein YlmC with PRC-barrel domain
MARNFNDSDEGKRVVNADGDEIGTVEEVSGNSAHVKPTSDLSNQMRQRLGWNQSGEESYALRHDTIDSIGDDEIRLKQNF